MKVARVLYPIKVLGPGKRIGIWLAGCPRRCEECSNPELWKPKNYQEILVDDLFQQLVNIIEKQSVDGITITGGDPFFQPKELAKLLRRIKNIMPDILVYTGYTLEELKASNQAAVHECLNDIGVLIDGPYIKALNKDCLLRGSENQKIIILNPAVKFKYEEYLATAHNEVQNFIIGEATISVGIHKPGFKEDLTKRLNMRGFMKHHGRR